MILYCWWKGLLVDFEIYTYVNSLNFETLSHQYMQKKRNRGPSIHAWHAHKGVETIDESEAKRLGENMTPKSMSFWRNSWREAKCVKNYGDEIGNVLLGEVDSCENLQPKVAVVPRCVTLGMTSPDFFFTSPSFSQIHLIKSFVQKKHVKVQFGSIHFLAHLGWDLDHYLSPEVPPPPFFGRSLLLRFSTIPSDKLT